MTYNNTDQEVKYTVENGLSGVRDKLGGIEEKSYDIARDTDLLAEIGVAVGIGVIIIALLNFFEFIMMVKIMMSM